MHKLPEFKGTPGPQVEHLKSKGVTFNKHFSCVEYFLVFFCGFVLSTFVASINAYGNANNQDWIDLTVPEFKAFLAVVIYFGCVRYPSRDVAFERGVQLTTESATRGMPKWHFINHILFIDNWYNSLLTVKICVDRGIEVVATVKTNSKNLPAEGKFPKTGRGKRARGTAQQLSMKIKGTDRDVHFIAWQDKKPVHMLSKNKFQESSYWQQP